MKQKFGTYKKEPKMEMKKPVFKTKLKSAVDPVNGPQHYLLREGYEVYDLRQDLAKKTEEIGVPNDWFSDWDRAVEYLLRMWEKNELEDAKKSRWYLNKLIEKLEENERTSKCTNTKQR